VHPISSFAERTFSRLSRLRRARALHPHGAVATATWTIDDPTSVLADVFGTAPISAVVRLSRGLGLPRPLPDVHGVAIRLEADGRRVDLLLSGTSRHLSTLLPYRTAGGLLLIELGREPAGFLVRERSLPGLARSVGRLDVGDPAADEAAAFDPYLHQHPALRPVRFLSALREAAYHGSRRGRLG
jgi:hypothetical protein